MLAVMPKCYAWNEVGDCQHHQIHQPKSLSAFKGSRLAVVKEVVLVLQSIKAVEVFIRLLNVRILAYVY
jgi:hypothetical protein